VENITIRPVSESDAAALLEIYRWYVVNTAVTFEYDVPSEAEFRERIRRTLEKYPYLAAEADGVLLGYAYAGAFKGRAAYDWAVELSIYLDKDRRGRGLGRRLYKALEEELAKMGILNLYACIASPVVEDEYLTRASERFHSRLGFVTAGRFHRCGYKFGRWYDMIWMEKFIGGHECPPTDVIPYPDL
jgi:phosphinothricin acetyltransferase